MTTDDAGERKLRQFFESLSDKEMEAFSKAIGDESDSEGGWRDGSKPSGPIFSYEKTRELIRMMSPEQQQDMANLIESKKAEQREWLGDYDDGFNGVPIAVLHGISPESDSGDKTVVHYAAWPDLIELMLRIGAVSFDESETLLEREDGIRSEKRCKTMAAKLRKWSQSFKEEDIVAFGPEDLSDMPEFSGFRVLAADEETDSDFCHAHIGNVRTFAEFLDQCGGFRWP